MSEIVTGVLSALIAIIVTLIGILKLYLPRLKPKSNPGSEEELAEIRRCLQALNVTLTAHCQLSARDHQDTMGALARIEAKLK